MAEIIQDGTGSGNTLEIDSNNHAHVMGFNEDYETYEMMKGGGYSISTGAISVTSGTSAVLFIKNGSSENYLINALRGSFGIGTSSNIKVEIIKNPTSGTIVDNASAVAGLSPTCWRISK